MLIYYIFQVINLLTLTWIEVFLSYRHLMDVGDLPYIVHAPAQYVLPVDLLECLFQVISGGLVLVPLNPCVQHDKGLLRKKVVIWLDGSHVMWGETQLEGQGYPIGVEGVGNVSQPELGFWDVFFCPLFVEVVFKFLNWNLKSL